MTGMMICDFWVVRARKIKLGDLYIPDDSSIYRFRHGVNWRAFVSWAIGFAPAMTGFINAVNTNIQVSDGAKRVFYLAYIEGFAISFTVHYLLNRYFPVRGLGEIDEQDIFATFSVDEARASGVVPYAGLGVV